ncbi:MAG: hypothetical protein IPG04_24240 [Polyangiaceae bacterium]|nr:hypothetical protein [Polyangiaceae bacterium]
MSDHAIREHAEVLREALEQVLLRADELSLAQARDQAQEVLSALSLLSGVSLESPDAAALMERARDGLGKLVLLAPDGDQDVVREAQEIAARLRLAIADRAASLTLPARAPHEEASAGAFTASVGSPALFHGVDVPAPELIPWGDPWAVYEEGGVDRRPARRESEHLEAAHLHELARDLMEDIASLGSLRRMRGLDPWGESAVFEDRLLAQLDALVSLARPARRGAGRLDLARELHRYAIEWFVPDGGRSFALAFVLSCLRADAAARWVVLAAERAPEETLHAFASGLALGSAPTVRGVVAALLASDRPALARVALEVARRRRQVDASVVAPLVAHPDGDVAEAALRALAVAGTEQTSRLFEQLAREAHASPRAARLGAVAAELSAARGDASGVRAARDILDRALASADLVAAEVALRVVAVAGDPRDLERVQRGALAVPGGLALLGFYGAPEVALVLAQGIRGAEPELPTRALARLTGLHVEPPYDVDAVMEQVAAWLKTASGRSRFGKPHTLAAVLGELRAPTTGQDDRRHLALEAQLLARRPLDVDLDGWVARQLAELEAFAAERP